jgi:3-oxoacyl-[acyl-carrier-protein] synthase II
MITEKTTEGITATTYLRMMSHTAAVNIGVFFGITGRIITTSSACTSGSQGIGYAYEAIKYGRQVAMLAGGAEELDATGAAVFDTLFATSTKHNEAPQLSPRPFHAQRDGLVLGEGACTLLLEELEHARARGATIHAEVLGYGTNSDGRHVTQPNSDTMAQAMRLALEDAGVPASAIPYVNAHGTATDQGDREESVATLAVFGEKVALSSLKSYMGHTLGACGALEAWMSIQMMRSDWFAPRRSPACRIPRWRARCWGRRTTCRPSRSGDRGTWTRPRTCMHSASCSTSAWWLLARSRQRPCRTLRC